VLIPQVPSSSSLGKGLYNPKAFVTHAASLDQACAHCPRFPTAASRRSLGRVSVPVWPIILSDRLPIAGTVGRYPTVYLIGRGPVPGQITPFCHSTYPVLAAVSRGCPRPQGRFPRVTHPCAAASPERPAARLACVKRAASVRSEPGSNSQLHPWQGRTKPTSQQPASPARPNRALAQKTAKPMPPKHPRKPKRPPEYPKDTNLTSCTSNAKHAARTSLHKK
jgi:hypothetical protein